MATVVITRDESIDAVDGAMTYDVMTTKTRALLAKSASKTS